jgi:hypothetical protein
MVEDQQRAWEVLAEKLKEESDSSAEEIDKVTEKMNNVVVIDESKTDYGGENTEDEQE